MNDITHSYTYIQCTYTYDFIKTYNYICVHTWVCPYDTNENFAKRAGRWRGIEKKGTLTEITHSMAKIDAAQIGGESQMRENMKKYKNKYFSYIKCIHVHIYAVTAHLDSVSVSTAELHSKRFTLPSVEADRWSGSNSGYSGL